MRTGNSLEYLLSDKESLEDLLWDHKMDISGSVHSRMQELGITQAELASKWEWIVLNYAESYLAKEI